MSSAPTTRRTSASSARPPSGTRGSFARSSLSGSRGGSGGGPKTRGRLSGQSTSRGFSRHSDQGATRTAKHRRTVTSSMSKVALYAVPDVRTTSSRPSPSWDEVPSTRITSTPSMAAASRPASTGVRVRWL